MKNYALILFVTLIFAFKLSAQTNFINLEENFECGSIFTYKKYPTEKSDLVLHLMVSEHDALFLEAKEVERKMYFFSNEEKECEDYTSSLFDLKLSFNPEEEKFYFRLGEREDEKTYQIVKKSTMYYNGIFFQYISNEMAFQLNYKEGKFEDLTKANSNAIVEFNEFDKKHSYHNMKLRVRSKDGKHPPRIMVVNPIIGIISLEDEYSSTINQGLVMELTSIDLFSYHDFLELKCKFHPETCDVILPDNITSKASSFIAANNNTSTNNETALDPTAPTLAVQPLSPDDYLASDENNIPSEYGQYGYIVVYDMGRRMYVNKLTGELANGFYGGVLYINGKSMAKNNDTYGANDFSLIPDENILLSSRGNEGKATKVNVEVAPKNESDCLEVSTLRTHVVQRGETILSIAKLYDIDVPSLKAWNGMKNAITLYPCKRLFLHPPKQDDLPKGQPRKIDCSESPTYNTHIVQVNENIVSIANFYGITTQQLKNWNGLRSNYLAPCTRLLIQPPTDYNIVMYQPQPAPQQEQSTRTAPTNYETIAPIPQVIENFHTVKKGDTLFSLAKKYDVSVSDLKKWNNLTSNLLKPGQRLKLQP